MSKKEYSLAFLDFCERRAETEGPKVLRLFRERYETLREFYGISESCKIALEELNIMINQAAP